MRKKKLQNARWALIAWVLAGAFFAMSYFYAMHDSMLGWLIWLALFFIWTYIAINATIQYFRQTNS